MAKSKKRKLKIKSILKFFAFLIFLALLISVLCDVKINNIVVKGNNVYTDWQIIKLAGLDNYPSTLKSPSINIKTKLEDNIYIKKATIKRPSFTRVVIEVTENKPLFYYLPNKKTILSDKKETEEEFSVPTVINYVPDKLYDRLISEMVNIDYDVVKRISEIKYDPNEVDEERFYLSMNDGNYVYLTLDKFNKIDKYLEIIKEFNNKKGVLYLDSGEYFEVKE